MSFFSTYVSTLIDFALAFGLRKLTYQLNIFYDVHGMRLHFQTLSGCYIGRFNMRF
ncbi:hypothetical protein B4125_0612 [Bacillus paralicheniformis]|nr:hypothetical protein B4125_0612 [Bacillus paralicheniformis]TWM51616.1 hypothetical protein CHCC14817_0017 [Bacillus paralicheniformis]